MQCAGAFITPCSTQAGLYTPYSEVIPNTLSKQRRNGVIRFGPRKSNMVRNERPAYSGANFKLEVDQISVFVAASIGLSSVVILFGVIDDSLGTRRITSCHGAPWTGLMKPSLTSWVT